MARPQKKGLSLKTQKSGQLVIEIKGQVRFTGFNIQGSSFEKGAVGIYEDLGKFTIGVERPGKAFKKYKLSSNIDSVRAKRDQLTIALCDHIQISARECLLQDVNQFEKYLNNIKLGIPLKGLLDPEDDIYDFVDESKENLRKRNLQTKGENKASVSSKLGRTVASQETPSKSPIFNRRHGSHLKAKMWDSPASQEWPEVESSFEITESKRLKPVLEKEKNNFVTSPSLSSAWARPPGEERNHSPRLMYDRRSVSPTCASLPRNKSPKSKRRLIDTQQALNDVIEWSDESDEENMIPLSSRGTSTVSKRPSDSKRTSTQSPLRLKPMQGSNYESTPKPTLVKSPPLSLSRKPAGFYSTSSSIAHQTSTGLQTNTGRRSLGLSKPASRRQLDLFAFKRRDQDKIYNKSPSAQLALTGFANLGNTCYMNAILQCLLGIPTFSYDLDNSMLIDKVSRMSLYKYLYNLSTAKKFNENQEKQRMILKNIKRAISNQAARFSGYMQHDAHEFLGQCLDQLKEDNLKLLPSSSETEEADESESQERKAIEAACPVSKNFECQVSHCIKCTECGSQITREEVFHDFSLDIPEIDENTDPEDKDLQDLLHDYFEEESIGYKCEKCDCENATLAHHISRLPRVVILHLKRYELDSDYTKYKKKLDTVDVPIELDLGVLCTDETAKAPQFEKTPKSGMKRPISNESPEDLDDFQIGHKARKKLSLPEVPKVSDPEKDNVTSLTFENDLEQAKKLSLETSVNLDTATEEEQLEWALKESMKTDRSDEENIIIPDDELPAELLAMDPLCDAEKMQGESYTGVVSRSDGSKKNEQTFTGVREKDNIIDLEKCEELEKSEISEWLSADVRKNEKEDDAFLMEGLDALENEDDELKRAIEISLKEYNERSTTKPRHSNHNNVKENSNNKRRKATQNSSVTPRKYRLLGIVSHIGDSSSTGHYISDVFDCKEKQWKSYNDTSVKKVNEYEVRYGRKHCAYIFFYIDEASFQAITSK